MPTIELRISHNGKKSYRAKVRLKGYPPQSETFERKTDAERWAQRVEADLREDKYFPGAKAKKHTVAELIDQYLGDVELRNPRRYREIKSMLEWWKGEIGYIVLSHFRSDQIVKAQKTLLTRKKQRRNKDGSTSVLTPATVNRHMQVLQKALAYGIRPLKWISENPARDIEKLEEPRGQARYLSPEEMNRLLQACKASRNKHLFAVVLIGIATGARRKEIQRMKWCDVNPEATQVTLPVTKNGEVRGLSLTGPAHEIVRKMREQKRDGEVFLFTSPNDINRPVDFETAWRFARKAAAVENFRFHDLRHTFASYLAMESASNLEMKEALGHKTLAMVSRYAHLAPSHATNVVSKMTEKVLGHVEI